MAGPQPLAIFDDSRRTTLLANGVNLPIKVTVAPALVTWCSIGSGGVCHYACTPFQLVRARTTWLPLMTPMIFAVLVLVGARRYGPGLVGTRPEAQPPPRDETPTPWHAAPHVHLFS